MRRWLNLFVVLFGLMLLSVQAVYAQTDTEKIEELIKREWGIVKEVNFKGGARSIEMIAVLTELNWEEDVREFFDSYAGGTMYEVFSTYPKVRFMSAKVYGVYGSEVVGSDRLLIYKTQATREQIEKIDFRQYGYAKGYRMVARSWLHQRFKTR